MGDSGAIGSMWRYIPKGKDLEPRTVVKDESYVLIKYCGAQAFWEGGWFNNLFNHAEQVVITSQVDLGLSGSNLAMKGIEFVQEVQSGVPVRIALKRDLFKLVPATMDSITLKLDFVIDLRNIVAQMAGLVNEGLLSPVLSMASPAADSAVRKVGEIAGKVIGTFMEGPKQSKDLVHVEADFGIATNQMKVGYYILIGTPHPDHPLPDGDEHTFDFDENRGLLIDGEPRRDLSWVALEVQSVPARGEFLRSEWVVQMDEIRAKAKWKSKDRHATAAERKATYDWCMDELERLDVLLQADPNYTDGEKEYMLNRAYLEVEGLFPKLKAAPGSATAKAPLPPVVGEGVLDKVAVAAESGGTGLRRGPTIKLLAAGAKSEEDVLKTLTEYEGKLKESRNVFLQFSR